MEWVAVTALGVSLISLGWQVFTWRQRRQPAALVLVRQEYNASPAVDDYTGEPIPGSWHGVFTIDVTTVNRGDVTFEVKEVGLVVDPTGPPAVWAFHDDGRPVAPGESLRESFDVAHLIAEFPDDPLSSVVGVVTLVSGETFTSGEPEPVDASSLALIAEQMALWACPMGPRSDARPPPPRFERVARDALGLAGRQISKAVERAASVRLFAFCDGEYALRALLIPDLLD
jgi:hypothetical protein